MVDRINYKFALVIITSIFISLQTFAQFTNRYPKLDGFRQQIYFEGFDLPICSTKPICYSPSPHKDEYCYCQNGKVYVSKANGELIQIPNEGFIDFQPRWNNDGSKIVFTRDDGTTTFIMLYDLVSTNVVTTYKSGKMDLDPAFSNEGQSIFFSSSAYGSFDVFIKSVNKDDARRITDFTTCELSPVQLNNDSIVYISKTQFGDDKIILYSIKESKSIVLKEIKFLGVCKLAVAQSKYLVYSWPEENTYSLKIISVANPEFEITVVKENSKNFLFPIFNSLNNSIYFNEYSNTDISVKKTLLWSKDFEIVPIQINKKNVTYKFAFKNINRTNSKKYFRLTVKDENNNYYFPKGEINIWSDPNLGNMYCYVSDSFKIELPPNKKFIFNYSCGLEFFSKDIDLGPVNPNSTTFLGYQIKWNYKFLGNNFYSGDNHFHLNVEGSYYLNISNLTSITKGEDLQFVSPLIANIGSRITDLPFFNSTTKSIVFGQEVRSHFHGHLSLLGGSKLFYPQFWGPFYEMYSDLDISNSSPINFGLKNNLLPTYVHPCFTDKPFDPSNIAKNTYDIFQNSVNHKKIGIELANIWSDETGTQEIYETILNTGSDIFLNAGTDAFPNFFRNPPIGSTRIFTYSKKLNYSYQDYLASISNGRSFVTNGPILLFSIADSLSGSVVKYSDSLSFSLNVFSYCDTLTFEIISNSSTIFKSEIMSPSNFYNLSGKIKCPQKGWISARVISKKIPAKYSDSYSFAYTSPIWINQKNKIPKNVQTTTAQKVINALEKNKITVDNAYNGKAPNQINDIDSAITKLKSIK